MQIPINDNYIPLLENQSRFLLIFGSAGSGKSVFAAQKKIIRCVTEPGHLFYCLRKVGESVKESIWAELLDVINTSGMAHEFTISEYHRTITHQSGSKIKCRGLDQVGKMKSVKGITGMWLDEADQFTEDDLDQLNIRIRGEKEYYIQYILTFNPVDEDHFLKSKFVDSKRSDTTFVKMTYRDNHFMTPEDIAVLEGYKETNPYYYQVYCLGEWGILDKSSKFLYAFDSKIHVDKCEVDPHLFLGLSFDFNVDPFTCLVYQREDICFRGIEEIRLSSDIEQVCDYILAKYPQSKYFYRVTGDASGKNRTGVVRGKTSYYRVIKANLQLSDGQFKLRGKNIGLIESKILCNSALQNYDVVLDPSLKETINDAKYSKVDDQGILIKDRDKHKNDHLDGFRYALDCEFPELTRKPKKR